MSDAKTAWFGWFVIIKSHDSILTLSILPKNVRIAARLNAPHTSEIYLPIASEDMC